MIFSSLKRHNNSVFPNASSAEVECASNSLICTHTTSTASNAWTQHTVSLKAAGSSPWFQRAEWKFAADDRSCEMKVLFTSSPLCLHLSGQPEPGHNPPPSVDITQWIQPLWKRAGGRTAAIFTALINTKPLHPSQITAYTTQCWRKTTVCSLQ